MPKFFAVAGGLGHLAGVRFIVILLAGLLASASGARAQAAHTTASLLLAAETARPGDTVLAGVRLSMEPGWHTYWKNAGGPGIPTEIEWKLPPGIKAGEIQWPLPTKLPDQEFTTYIYESETMLLVPLTLGPELKPGTLDLQAEVKWLECKVQCVPGSETVKASLGIAPETKPSSSAGLIEAWQKKVPRPGGPPALRATWEAPANVNPRSLILEWTAGDRNVEADFFPYAAEKFEVHGDTLRLPPDGGKQRLRIKVQKQEGDWPKELAGVLVQKAGAERTGFEVKTAIEGSAAAAVTGAAGGGPGTVSAGASLWRMLLYAFIGGLILNIMPCVLPVIALKILGFVGQSRDHPGRVRLLGVIYALGVLASFLALALIVIGLQAAGRQAGWGMQFANPQFLVILTVLVTLVALNLFGLFEVTLSGRVMGAAGDLASHHGAAGAFFNGVLATLLATPCTAPFLGAALGFAFSQPPAIILLMFATVALGLALPYIILSWDPRWLAFLPKPGAWMEKFKIAMGFPMLATAVWLFSLLPIHFGDRAWWLGVFLVVLALAAWIFGEFFQRGRARRGLALGLALALLATAYGFVLEGKLDWRAKPAPGAVSAKGTTRSVHPAGAEWLPWSPEAVAKARVEGHLVLVDFTAAWCLTCNIYVKPALEGESLLKKIKDLKVTTLVADYTLTPENMTVELKKHGRAGVPLVLVYPKDPAAPPIILPEALTTGMVVEALNQASGSR
jgi:thiol:disulfide interchange protein DsbD